MFALVDLRSDDHRVLVGTDTLDDAGVYRLTADTALIQTIDYFTPIVDDPYVFGQIAAANALSDIYAMGGRPLTALNIVGFPIDKLPHQVLADILRGGHDKVVEAGAALLGGHSIDDTDPKYGLAVTGVVHPDRIWTNGGAKPGDVLVLTKPLGVGIITTGIKRGLADEREIAEVTQVMTTLNRVAAEVASRHDVHACTDVTGFGLLGHALEMAGSSAIDIELWADQVPLLPASGRLLAAGCVPGGTRRNQQFVENRVRFDDVVDADLRVLLADSVTSGGLLLAVPAASADELTADLQAAGVSAARQIGRAITASRSPSIVVHRAR